MKEQSTEFPLVPSTKRARGRPRKTPDDRNDGNRRQALLRAAAKLFRRKGFGGTSTRDIAAEVGMQSGSLFYHFKSKGAMLYAVMETGMHVAIECQAQALSSESGTSDAHDALRRLIRAHFHVLLGLGNDFVPVMLYESRSLSTQERITLAELVAQYEAVWTQVLQALHDSGQLQTPVTLSRLLILGALNWTVQWFDRKQEASIDVLTDAAMALLLKEPSDRTCENAKRQA